MDGINSDSIAKVSRLIHRKESHLWGIEKANKGIEKYVQAYKDAYKRNQTASRLRNELELLLAHRENLYNSQPKEKWYPGLRRCGRTKGTKNSAINNRNTYLCSDGTRVTQAEIDKKRSEAYRIKYQDNPCPIDEGFREKRAKCTAHIIPQARCKQIGKTELIWDIDNMFAATFESNQAIENPKGEAWKNLKNINYCLNFIERHDPELYAKFESNFEIIT